MLRQGCRFWARLSPSYFVSNLGDAVCNLYHDETNYVWFAFPGGERQHVIAESAEKIVRPPHKPRPETKESAAAAIQADSWYH